VHGAAHAHLLELLDHHAAGRQHQVELAVQVGEIVAGAARDPAAQARLHQARQVGVIEGDGGHLVALAHAQRGPGAVAGVARLDQVGVGRFEQAHRAGHRQRHAVAVEAGQPGGGNTDQRRHRVAAGFDIGTEDGVLNMAAPCQPLRLGIQIGADAAAFGRVKHRDVDKVHSRFRSNYGRMRPTIAADLVCSLRTVNREP
jgi:hypothetical protein